MLDFLLILGQVPGTNIQLTFNEIMAVYFVAACFLVYVSFFGGLKNTRRAFGSSRQLALSLTYRTFILAAKLIRRKAVTLQAGILIRHLARR